MGHRSSPPGSRLPVVEDLGEEPPAPLAPAPPHPPLRSVPGPQEHDLHMCPHMPVSQHHLPPHWEVCTPSTLNPPRGDCPGCTISATSATQHCDEGLFNLPMAVWEARVVMMPAVATAALFTVAVK